jgi:Tfp pilus assembly protein PilV
MEIKNLEKKIKVKANQAGFSLIEVVTSMTMFLMITGTVYGLLELGRTNRNASSNRSDTQKNARVSLYLIGRDLMNAGLGFHKQGAYSPNAYLQNILDVEPDVNPDRDVLTSLSIGNNVHSNVLGGTVKTDAIFMTYRDLTFNDSSSIQVVDETSANQNQITLQTLAGKTALVNLYDVFIAETVSTQVMLVVTAKDDYADQITFAFGDPLGLNQVRSGGVDVYANSLLRKCGVNENTGCTAYHPALPTASPAEQAAQTVVNLKKVIGVQYKVDENGTLTRIIYGNNRGATPANQIQTQPLIYGIKNLQFEYVLNNGTVTDDPVKGVDGTRGTTDDTPGELNKIRQVSVDLIIVAEAKDGRTGVREETRLNSTFSTRNLQYDDR